MKSMKTPGLVAALLIGLLPAAAEAREPKASRHAADDHDYVNKEIPGGASVWHCWYDGAVSIQCRLGEPAAAPAGVATAVDPRLPEIVHKVWHQAAELAGSAVAIPLHTIPFDMAMTGRLAEAVMCGGATQPCGIVFARSKARLSETLQRREVELAARRLGGLVLAD